MTKEFQIFSDDEMTKNIKDLYNEFIKIRKKGWIACEKKGLSGIGYTFEKLLSKKADSFFLPDYNGIEIKTKHHFSKGFITLFCLNPDGDYLFPIEYLKNTYGYPDKDMPDKKVFIFDVANFQDCSSHRFAFKLKMDYEHEKVILEIKNLKTGSIDNCISWSFQSIKERLYIKLSYLAIIKAANKYINDNEYFHYYDIKFYKLKDFDVFLTLLEEGKIRIKFNIGIFKNGRRKGETNNHGVSFDIHIDNIPLLFNCISV